MAEEEPLILFRSNTPLEKGRSEEAGSGEEKVLTCSRQKQIGLFSTLLLSPHWRAIVWEEMFEGTSALPDSEDEGHISDENKELGHHSCTML